MNSYGLGLFLLIILLSYLFIFCIIKISYNRLLPGREVFIYIEGKQDVERDVILKHEDGIIYTQKHGCFTFKDYLNDKITEY